MVFGWLFFTFSVIPIIKPLKGYWLDEFYDLKLRIAQRNQARFDKKIFLELAGIDLGFPRMLA